MHRLLPTDAFSATVAVTPTMERARCAQKGPTMSSVAASQVRLSEVLTKLGDKLAKLKKADADNVRKAFDAAVTAASDADGVCSGLKLQRGLRKVVDAIPEGSIQDYADLALERIEEERQYRGDPWLNVGLLGALRGYVGAFKA
jgi:hypothetical protein